MAEEDNVAVSILEALTQALQANRTPIEQIDLPIFNPDSDDAAKWIGFVDNIRSEFNMSDLQILVRVGRFLLHGSKRWFERWSPDTRDFSTFKRDFLEAFPPKRNLGRLLEDAAAYNSSFVNNYETYIHEKLALLRKLRASWTESDLVELIVHGIVESDVKNTAMNRDCKTISELISYVTSFRKPPKCTTSQAKKSDSPPPKRRCLMPRVPNKNSKCFNCGKPGHVKAQCRLADRKPVIRDVPNVHVKTENKPADSKPTCLFCARQGHTIDECFTKAGIDKRKSVNFCTSGVDKEPTVVSIDGIEFRGLIDTGADISLLSDKFTHLFQHKMKPSIQLIRGIGKDFIQTTHSFNAETIITGEKTIITFFVVPESFVDYDVYVGRNLFNDRSLATITDYRGSKVVRQAMPEVNVITTSSCFDTSKIAVPTEYHQSLITVLEPFKDIITVGNCVGTVNNTSLQIRLEKDVIISRAPYRLSVDERATVRGIIDDLMRNGIIRESESPFASPILLVKKKDGSHRMCVDYRELNRHTVKDRYPLPLVEDQLDRLGTGRYFTTLDMASGFHQIAVHENSIEKTAFVTPDGHYEYLRVPFGLANAPAVFQRAIHNALGSLRHSVALIYLDDILIPSKTPEEGLESLNLVLTALKSAGFFLNMKKCKFLQDSVEYLGREVSAEGIRPGKQKIEALVNSPVPTNVKSVRQFMGLAGFFRKFIPDFARCTAPITKLTKKSEPFSWTDEQEVARQYVISHLTSRPLLVIFDPNLPTELHTDASSLGYGGILFQKYDGSLRVVAYFSQRTSKHEANYHSYELETLAIVRALKHFRTYLLGINFTLVTDCNSVKSTANKKDLIPRVARWWVYLQDFTFNIVYRKGSSLPHVDYLSRNPAHVRRISHQNWLYIEQKGSSEVRDMLNNLREGKLDANQYEERDDLLFHKNKNSDGSTNLQWFVPRQSRLGLLRIFHDEQCHVGTDKTYNSISKFFWFPRMRLFIKNYVKHCIICAVKKTRTGPLQGFIQTVQKPSQPFHVVHVDCLGPLPITPEGHKHILVLVDAFTKYCLLIPMKSVTAVETREQLQFVVSLFGTPKCLVMDAGSNFKNTSLPKYLNELQIEYHYITPDVHRGNGQVERYMRTVMNLIRIETKVKSEWSSGLWKLQLVLNSTIHKATQTSPLSLLLGIEGSVPIIQALLRDLSSDLAPIRSRDIDRERVRGLLNQSTKCPNKVNDRRRNTVEYAVGDFVLMHRNSKMHISKTDYEFLGPFEIIKCLENERYEIKKVGSSVITKAAKEQLRKWPAEWSVSCDMQELLELLEADGNESENESCKCQM